MHINLNIMNTFIQLQFFSFITDNKSHDTIMDLTYLIWQLPLSYIQCKLYATIINFMNSLKLLFVSH